MSQDPISEGTRSKQPWVEEAAIWAEVNKADIVKPCPVEDIGSYKCDLKTLNFFSLNHYAAQG